MRYPTNAISFDEKPEARVIEALKTYGFRWNRRSMCWSAPQSVESATVIDCIKQGDLDGLTERVAIARMQADVGII